MRFTLFLLALSAFAAPPTLRLPETSKPLRYRIELSLDPSKQGYSGSVDIEIEVTKSTREIWLNAEGLAISKAISARAGQAKVTIQPHDFAGLEFSAPLAPGKAEIHIEFTGQFDSKNSNGIFRMQEDGDWYAYTQFEPIAARAGFPCYDEPGFKVPWQLTLRVPSGLKAVANAPQTSETFEGGWKRIQFAQSKPMPSYLVAFAVGPFEFVDAGTAGMKKTPLRIIAPRGKAAEARYAVEVTGKVLAELESYFGIPYPFEKLDSIAIPLTFGFGAMENAGLITYARTLLLSPPGKETDSFRQGYLSVAAHEIAHQWFGNLVTPEYWDDIWLNEAFATWLESKITQKMRPEWKREISKVEGRGGVMQQDSLISARQIRQPIEDNGDIVSAFDGITYTKGAAVIGMFENYVGESEFRAGVQRYMKQYEWRNATSGMFLDSISSPKGKNVSAAFSTFLNQPGVPLLTASLKCGGGKATLNLKQERLLPVGSKGTTQQAWQLPVCFAFEKDGKPVRECRMLTSPSAEFALDTKSCPAWVNADSGASGYYRVAYDAGMMSTLAKSKSLSVVETVDLLDNASMLVTTGRLSVADAIGLSRQYAGDPEWRVAGRSLELLSSLNPLVRDEDRAAYAKLIQDNYGARARKLGWNNQTDPDQAREQRDLVPAVSRLGEDQDLRQEALRLGRAWLKDRSVISPDLARPVIEIAAVAGGASFYDEMVAELQKTRDRSERAVLIGAMSRTGNPDLAQRGFKMLVNKDVDFREGMRLLLIEGGGPSTSMLPYQFVRENFDAVMAVAPSGGSFNFGSILPMVAGAYCETSKVSELREFFEPRLKGVNGAERSLNSVSERIELCAARKAALDPQLHQLLAVR